MEPVTSPAVTDDVTLSVWLVVGVSTDSAFSLLKESIEKMGIASRAEIERWCTPEMLGVSG